MAVANGQYGEDVWERKIKAQNEVGVISGVIGSIKKINIRTKKIISLLEEEVFPQIKQKAKVLDAGCGPLARFSIEFSKRGYDTIGVDISDTTLNYAKKYAEKNNTKITFVKDDMTELKKIPKGLDLIFCYSTFYHIPPHLTGIALMRFNEKLKKGGFGFIEFGVARKKTLKDFFWSIFYWTGHYLKRLFGKGFKVNISYFTKKEINELILKSGFKIKKIFPGNNYFIQKV
jgi:2-polyprenyl-3-methyl-5-hydroxy-6-metoxy-1,4-benzoquinol methylase